MSSLQNLSELFKQEFAPYRYVGILGFGREGKSTYMLIRKYCPELKLVIADQNPNAFKDHAVRNDAHAQILEGDDYLKIFSLAEFVFVSPGIPLFGTVVPPQVKISSQTDILFRHFGHQIVAVTGTKGKSTTASLIAHMLKMKYANVPLAGNIGIPAFDVIEQLHTVDYAVFEVSSHQLQHISAAPKVALLLNLFPEHLDYYPDTETYYNAKRNIFKFQKKDDCIVLNNDETEVWTSFNDTPATVLYYSVKDHGYIGAFLKNNMICFRQEELKQIMSVYDLQLKGMHNISNCLAAVSACGFLSLGITEMQSGLKTFTGLPHRMEKIVSQSGRIFYNDSIATIPEASLAAIEALSPVATLILGGMDRGLPYDDFLKQIFSGNVKNICFYGDAGLRMFQKTETLIHNKKYFYHKEFEQCVGQAISATAENEICLLSPAASSYDQFKNFEERGEAFRMIVFEV